MQREIRIKIDTQAKNGFNHAMKREREDLQQNAISGMSATDMASYRVLSQKVE